MAAERVHIPIGSDVELDQAIDQGGGEGGPTALTDLSDVTGTPQPGYSPVADESSTMFPLTRVTTQDDLDAILQAVAEVDYVELELENGFTNYGSPWVPARYRLQANNIVRLDGVICRDDLVLEPVNIATLPPAVCPDGALLFLAASDNSVSRVNVQPDGSIEWRAYLAGTSGAESYLSLSGIAFSVGGADTVAAAAVAERMGPE